MHRTITAEDLGRLHAERVQPDSFDPGRHYYPKVLNAQVHSMVAFFFRMTRDQIVNRYCHLHPGVDPVALQGFLGGVNKHLHWGGADLFYTTTSTGVRRMVVLEVNSCPSGNKSMPFLEDGEEQGGYRRLLTRSFLPLLERRRNLPKGDLAVLYDKNFQEASGYAAVLADLTGEDVLLAPLPDDAPDCPVRFDEGLLEVRDEEGDWRPVRAAFRYVTRRPWHRIPVRTRTFVYNPVIGCLAGGRNKILASKAYEFLNAEHQHKGLSIRIPETVRDVGYEEIPFWVQRFGGYAVVKNPYSNSGQGVWTLTGEADLEAFLALEHTYDRFLVQALIGNSGWTAEHKGSRYFHVGTMPDRQGRIYVADIRLMVCNGPDGFSPVAIYARRAREPLLDDPQGASAWDMLGTNLSERDAEGGWNADTDRLMIMDRRDFNRLGLGPDDLVEAYVQTVLAVTAIDRLAESLTGTRGGLRSRLFRSMNDDRTLFDEIRR